MNRLMNLLTDIADRFKGEYEQLPWQTRIYLWLVLINVVIIFLWWLASH